jgi:NCK adaptor protein 2
VPRNYLQELSEYLAEPYRGGRSLERPTNGGGSLRAVSQVSLAVHDRPHLVGKPWYYGPITRAHCDTILNEAGQDGDFLIRDSETNVSLVNLNFLPRVRHHFNHLILSLSDSL